MTLPAARKGWILFLVAGLGVLLPLAMVVLAVTVIAPPPGPPLATQDIESGTEFELSYVSDGQPQRVFLELECERCSLPVDGTLSAAAGDTPLTSVEISAGNDTVGPLTEHLLISIPAQPASRRVTVRGTLTVHRERGLLFNEPLADAPDPVIHVFRLTIAP